MSSLTRNLHEIQQAIENGAHRFKRALKDRQTNQADGIRKRDAEIKKLEDDLIAANGTNTKVPYRSGSKGQHGETQTALHMQANGYESINGPGHSVNSNGVDDIFIHTDTGHVIVVESKYNTSRLGNTKSGEQMSLQWLLNGVRNRGDTRLDRAMDGSTSPLTGIDIEEGLLTGIVSRAVSHVSPDGSVNISFLR